jgi:hypothetical protein
MHMLRCYGSLQLRQDLPDNSFLFVWLVGVRARDHLAVALELSVVQGVSENKDCMLPFHCKPL